ncbi:hypothetical protein ERO13_A06G181350v2 [Gossypium hirsutum]|nr:hypothetical protein ERO13_A06G181350v2 [Gossypium hirsutum]
MVFEQRLSDLPFPSRLFIYPVPKVPGSTTTCRLLRHYDRRVPYAMCSWHHHVEYWYKSFCGAGRLFRNS